MICQKCGMKIPDDSEFCQYCGEKVQVQVEQTPSAINNATQGNSNCSQATTVVSEPQMKECSAKDKCSIIEYLRQKPSRKWLATVACLSIVFLGLIALNVNQHITVIELTETVDNLNSTISEKDKQIKSKDSKITSLTDDAESFQNIVDAVEDGSLGYASNNFRSSESIIVVGENDQNRHFTLTAYWSNGGNVSVEYDWYSDEYSPSAYVDFDQDSWSTSTTMSIEPMHSGVVVVTFSNDVDSQTFDVIIVVV